MRLSCFLLGLFTTVVAQSQNQSISGYVKFDGEPVPGATVQIVNQQIGTTTNAEGYFELSGEIPRAAMLEVRSMGLKPRTIPLATSKGTLTILMEESTINLNGVVVTGSMKPTFISDSPTKVEVVTSSHITTYLPSAASGLVQSMTLVNGVQEVVACGVCFTNSISINGLPGPYTAVLMDGSPIFGNLASVYGLNGIPSMIIDRLEVIKGPSSTLYGSEAVAGVINIITKDPAKQPTVSVDIMETSHLESFGNFAFAPKLKKWKGFIGLNYAYINDYDDRNGDGFGDQANLDRVSLFTKWNVPTRSGKPFSLAAKYYYEDRRNGVESFLENRAYQDIRGHNQIYGESIYTNRAELFGSYGLPTSAHLRLDYSVSAHKQDSYYGSDFYLAKQYIGYSNLVWQHSVSKHEIVGGLTNRVQYYDDNTVATQRFDSLGMKLANHRLQYIPGVFGQDEWRMSKKWTILAGLRLDHYTSYGLIPAPRLNAKYKVTDWTTIRLNFGTGFRIVNLFTEDHAFLSGQREVEISGTLKPEKSFNFTLNTNHVFTLGESQGMIDIDVFYTHFSNKIIPDYSDPQLIRYENTGGFAATRGIGMNFNQEFRFPLAFNLGVNVQKATETEEINGEKQTERILMSQAWSGVFTANYTISPLKLALSVTSRVTGPLRLPTVFDLNENGNPQPTSRPTTSTPYAIHNVQLKRSFGKQVDVYGGVQNIADYIQPYSPLTGYNDPNSAPGFSSSFDTSYAYAPLHGREIYLGVRWRSK